MLERPWRSLKHEDIYIKEYETVADLLDRFREYFKFYNNCCPHHGLNGRTPADVYYKTPLLRIAA